MGKAKPHPDQMGFAFEAPQAATGEASLAGLDAMISRTVGQILNSDTRTREVIAAEMTVLLGDEVSRAMLDAYASPARTSHSISATRLLALVAVTKRHDLFDPLVRQIGAGLLVGDEVMTARLGHIEQRIKALQAEKRALGGTAPLIRGGQN